MARKSTKSEIEVAEAGERRAATPEMTPLDYMLSVMRDETASPTDRKWAAAHAAPYLHLKLSSTNPQDGGMTYEQMLDELD